MVHYFRELIRGALCAFPHRRAYGVAAGLFLLALLFDRTVGIYRRLDSPNPIVAIALKLLFFASAYYGTVGLLALLRLLPRLPRSFWWRSLLALLVIAVVSGVSLDALMPHASGLRARRYYEALSSKSKTLLIGMPLLLLLKLSLDRHRPGLLHGWIRTPLRSLVPYAQAMLALAPLLFAASFTFAFQHKYPVVNVLAGTHPRGIPKMLAFGLFEAIYLLNFFAVETLWRGSLTVLPVSEDEPTGLVPQETTTLRYALLLPMAVAYGFLHFGKPTGEALLSVPGGWLLGVAALRTGHIWGGVIAHVSIAFMMEAFAYLQWAF